MRKSNKNNNEELFPTEAAQVGIETIPNAYLWPITQLRPNPEQPRTTWDIEEVVALAVNLKRLADKGQGIAGLGFIHALSGHWAPGQFDESGDVPPGAIINITAGETRWRAATMIYEGRLDVTPDYKILSYNVLPPSPDRADKRFARIPIVVTNQTSVQAKRNALFENIMRQNLPILDEAREIRALMNDENLSFQQAAQYLGKKKSWVQARLDALRAGEDVQKLIRSRPDTLHAAQRIDRIKEPEVRQLLIDLVANMQSFPRVEPLKAIADIPNARSRAAVIKRIRQQMESELPHGKFNVNRALSEMRRGLPGDYVESSDGEEQEEGFTYGKKKNGALVAPTYNLADALDGVARELGSATLTPALRRALKPKVARLMEILEG